MCRSKKRNGRSRRPIVSSQRSLGCCFGRIRHPGDRPWTVGRPRALQETFDLRRPSGATVKITSEPDAHLPAERAVSSARFHLELNTAVIGYLGRWLRQPPMGAAISPPGCAIPGAASRLGPWSARACGSTIQRLGSGCQVCDPDRRA